MLSFGRDETAIRAVWRGQSGAMTVLSGMNGRVKRDEWSGFIPRFFSHLEYLLEYSSSKKLWLFNCVLHVSLF